MYIIILEFFLSTLKYFSKNIFDILKSLSIIVASFAALKGINEWRRELKSKKQMELAEEVLVLFYQCKDHIKMIRNPFSYKGEGSTRKSSSGETPQ